MAKRTTRHLIIDCRERILRSFESIESDLMYMDELSEGKSYVISSALPSILKNVEVSKAFVKDMLKGL